MHIYNKLIKQNSNTLPDRFEKQLAVFKNKDVDVCGAWVGEFEDDESEIVSFNRMWKRITNE